MQNAKFLFENNLFLISRINFFRKNKTRSRSFTETMKILGYFFFGDEEENKDQEPDTYFFKRTIPSMVDLTQISYDFSPYSFQQVIEYVPIINYVNRLFLTD